jgi:hypothetical protein
MFARYPASALQWRQEVCRHAPADERPKNGRRGEEDPWMSDPPPELAKRAEEWCSQLSARDWDGLAALYHPDYRGRRGVAQYLTAAEEVSRLREEVSGHPGATTRCRLTPLSTTASQVEARWTVEERLEQLWSDGCRRVTVRRFEQQWRCADGAWRLYWTERVPRSERAWHETALLFRNELEWTEQLGQPDGSQPPGSRFDRWLLHSYLHTFDSLMTSQSLSVQVEPGAAPPEAVTALQRASEAGIEAWNRSLEGALELRLQSGPGTPDILIRGWGRPIFGSVLGLATFAHRHRASAVRARLGEVWIPLVEHPGTPALTRDPVDLYDTICHELGHCFGLDHCAANHAGARRNSVMGPRDWQTPPPAAPFQAERRAVLHWLQAAHGWRASECRRRGQVEQAEIEESRAAQLQGQAGRELWDGPFPPIGLELEDVPVPAPVRHYWMGNAAWRRGDRKQARASYDQALVDGTLYPEVLVRRGWLQGRDSEGLADLRRASEITPSWALAREALIGLLQATGRGREADVERAVLRWLAGREKVEEYWLTACTVSPRWVGAIAAAFAGGWAARCAVAAVHARIIMARRRPRPESSAK